MNIKNVRFSNDVNIEFIDVLRKRVKEYFDSRNITVYGNAGMVTKTIVMLLLYTIPYVLMISGIFSNEWIVLILWLGMGLGMAGIGFSVMHDANHGSYSKNSKVNYYLGYTMNFIGGSTTNWKLQHNTLHHSFTNVDGIDEDISIGNLMRFSPNQKRYKLHRFQHFYSWFLYSLMTLSWVLWKDFPQLIHYKKIGLTSKLNKSFKWLMTELVVSKLFYISYALVIPILVLKIPIWETILFFISMHLLTGLIFSCIFQPAHVVPTSEYPVPDNKGLIDNSWAMHQIATTSDFAPKSKLFSWFIGGLNFQVEHHLFPNICHVHYRKIAIIVKDTAIEYGLTYHSQSTFVKALWTHFKMLKILGKYDSVRFVKV